MLPNWQPIEALPLIAGKDKNHVVTAETNPELMAILAAEVAFHLDK